MRPLIIFDFDGTIADSIDANISIINEVAVEQGYAQSLSREMLAKHSLQQAVRKMGVPFFKLPSFLQQAKQRFQERLPAVDVHPHVIKLVQDISTHADLIIVSSNSVKNIKSILSEQFQECFEEIIESGLFTKNRLIKKLRKQRGLSKDEVLYIGDESRDIHAAKRAGVESMAVTWGLQGEEPLLKSRPTMLAKTSTEAEHLLKAWIVSRD